MTSQLSSLSPFHTTALRHYILDFLDGRSIALSHSVSQLFEKNVPRDRPVLDIRNKPLDSATIARVAKKYRPKSLRIKLSSNTQNAGLCRLQNLKVPIHSLDISDCSITKKGLNALPSLKELYLKDDIAIAKLRLLMQKKMSLESIHIAPCLHREPLNAATCLHREFVQLALSSSSVELEQFQSIPIRSIDASHWRPMTIDLNVLCEEFGKLKSLEKIGFPKLASDQRPCVPIHAQGVTAIAALPHLKHLSFSHIQNNEALQILGTLKNLEFLEITDTPMDDERIAFLQGLTHLRKVYIRGSKNLTQTGMDYLQKLPLTEFSISHANITEEFLEILSRFKHLSLLRLIDCTAFDDRGLKHFNSHRGLKTLIVSNTPIKGDGLAFLQQPLDTLVLENALNPISFAALREVPANHIVISGSFPHDLAILRNSPATNLTLKAPLLNSKALKSLPTLKNLTQATISIRPVVSMRALHRLKQLSLRHLTMTSSALTDQRLAAISHIRTLESLRFEQVFMEKVTTRGLFKLKRLQHLHSIHDQAPRDNPILDHAIQNRMQSVLRESWFMRLFPDAAYVRIQYPKKMFLKAEGGYSATKPYSPLSPTRVYRTEEENDQTQVFLIKGIAEYAKIQCQYQGLLEKQRHFIHPRTITTLCPEFPPTIIRAFSKQLLNEPLYIRGNDPLTPLIPMEKQNGYWKAAFRIPIWSYQIHCRTIPENKKHLIACTIGFGYTHDVFPHFRNQSTLSPIRMIQIFCSLPPGHIPYVRTADKETPIPLVSIGNHLWEGRTIRLLTSCHIYIDNQHKEKGKAHPIKPGITVCIPEFEKNLELTPPPKITTILVKFKAPSGHAPYLHTDKESIPMVPVGQRTWKTHLPHPPPFVKVSLDGVALAKGKPITPEPGGLTVIKPTFKYQKIVEL